MVVLLLHFIRIFTDLKKPPVLQQSLEDAAAEAPAATNTADATNSATPPVTTALATRAHPTTTDAWARDAFPTTWTRHTRIADFGTATAVPEAVPLTDYRRSFAPLGCGKPKTWLESHLPSLREETRAEVVAEGAGLWSKALRPRMRPCEQP